MATTASIAAERAPASDKGRIARLCLPLLLVVCFCLATDLSLWFQTWQGNRTESANLLAVAMGDARRMFANHFFVKADAYFHSGYYPTIFDNRETVRTPHIAEDSGVVEGKNTGDDEIAFLTPSRNWIERFGRELYPTAHSELAAGGANGREEIGAVREILPWLKLSAQFDPKRTETYTVTAFWPARRSRNPASAARTSNDESFFEIVRAGSGAVLRRRLRHTVEGHRPKRPGRNLLCLQIQ